MALNSARSTPIESMEEPPSYLSTVLSAPPPLQSFDAFRKVRPLECSAVLHPCTTRPDHADLFPVLLPSKHTSPPLAHSHRPQTNSTYRERTARGGFFTVVIGLLLGALIWTELREYLWGEPDYSFSVDKGISHDLQINFDTTVATPCHCAYLPHPASAPNQADLSLPF
jgi:hypothetical protein